MSLLRSLTYALLRRPFITYPPSQAKTKDLTCHTWRAQLSSRSNSHPQQQPPDPESDSKSASDLGATLERISPEHKRAYDEINAESGKKKIFDPDWMFQQMSGFALLQRELKDAAGDPVKEREAVDRSMARRLQAVVYEVEERVKVNRRRDGSSGREGEELGGDGGRPGSSGETREASRAEDHREGE